MLSPSVVQQHQDQLLILHQGLHHHPLVVDTLLLHGDVLRSLQQYLIHSGVSLQSLLHAASSVVILSGSWNLVERKLKTSQLII